MKTVFILIISWIALNIFIPVTIRSIERQFQKQIDCFIFRVLTLFKKLPFELFRIVLVILMLPNIILFNLLHGCFPKLYNSSSFFKVGLDFFKGILRKDFRKNYKTLIKNLFIVQEYERKTKSPPFSAG